MAMLRLGSDIVFRSVFAAFSRKFGLIVKIFLKKLQKRPFFYKKRYEGCFVTLHWNARFISPVSTQLNSLTQLIETEE